MHEWYSHKHFHNDICIIHLDDWAREEGISTVRLPSRSQVKETFAGHTATVSGWGGISNADAPINPELKYADVTIMDNQHYAVTSSQKQLQTRSDFALTTLTVRETLAARSPSLNQTE
ncbi:collagenase-like [Cloeon dipterum]|uniref:collagenase-like n=1 Tax=Cloeon dipterum TaxID=197152 RepID=UPI0032203BDF